MSAPAAFIAISTVRRIRSRWHPPRCCAVVKLCCKSKFQRAKGKVLRTADGPRRLRFTMQRHACRPPPPDLRIPSLWEGGASLWRQLRQLRIAGSRPPPSHTAPQYSTCGSSHQQWQPPQQQQQQQQPSTDAVSCHSNSSFTKATMWPAIQSRQAAEPLLVFSVLYCII
jgi:hypothetical protein